MDCTLVLLLHDGLAISWYSAELMQNEPLSHGHQISECMIKHNFHTSNSHEYMGVNGEALQLHAVYYLNYKSHKNQVRIHIRYYKSRVLKMFMKWKL